MSKFDQARLERLNKKIERETNQKIIISIIVFILDFVWSIFILFVFTKVLFFLEIF